MPTRFIELAGEINTAEPRRVCDALAAALSRRKKQSLNGARILMMGLAYKKNVDDTRESPALAIMRTLEARGASRRILRSLDRRSAGDARAFRICRTQMCGMDAGRRSRIATTRP